MIEREEFESLMSLLKDHYEMSISWVTSLLTAVHILQHVVGCRNVFS